MRKISQTDKTILTVLYFLSYLASVMLRLHLAVLMTRNET